MPESRVASMSFHFFSTAARAAVLSDQLPLFDVKLALGHDLPFMEATAAQCLAFVFVFGAGAFEGEDVISHGDHSGLGYSCLILTQPWVYE